MAEEATSKPRKGRPRTQQRCNGVWRPTKGTITRRVWDVADKLAEKHPPEDVSNEMLMNHPECAGIKIATIRAHRSNWRRFRGIQERKRGRPRNA